MDRKAPDSTISPSKGESKRKRMRREEEQNSFDEGKVGGKDDTSREESELTDSIYSKASDPTMSPSKGKSKRKKRRTEVEQNSFDGVEIGCKDGISRRESESKGNMDSKASDSAISPSKGESKRKKRRREEEQNSFDEGKVGGKDDTSREESELTDSIYSKASDPTMSPSKGKSKRKKRRTEVEQNSFDGVDIGCKDGVSRQDESKGNMDSKASDSTTSTSKGESERKKTKREEKQDSFEEAEIGRKDDISRQESELKGNMDSKASEMAPSKGKSKRKKIVRFQEPDKGDAYENVTYMPREKDIENDVAFFSLGRNWYKDKAILDLHYGRFTKDEDEKIKNGVINYIKMRGWDEKEGLEAVLHSLHTDARGCWLEIARCLPHRPVKQFYTRAVRLLEYSKHGKWSAEELEELKSLQNQYGSDWKKIGSYLGRTAQLCKDKWRHLKLVSTRKTGIWAQDEYDALCKLVRRSLRVKASIGAKTLDRRQIRDDINWEWIEEKMQRDSMRCSEAWYKRLASPMIKAKEWANGDDQLLLERLMELGAGSEEALDWDTILDHRDGERCMARWKEMTRLLGKSDHASFEDKLEILAKRYAPHLLGIEEEV